MMKTIYLIISSISLTLLLSACGGGGGDTTFDSGIRKYDAINCDNSNAGIGINDCGDVLIPNYYICLKTNDTLVSSSDNTLLEIIEKADGTKKVCVKNTMPIGSAYILRGK